MGYSREELIGHCLIKNPSEMGVPSKQNNTAVKALYEMMTLYYVKSVLTEISVSRQDRRVLQNHQNQISEHMGHVKDV